MALTAFHPALQRWFSTRLGEPTEPQSQGWPLIRQGFNTLISAPTGMGKTLAAFLSAVDFLLRQGSSLGDQTQVLYISPLRALSNDIQKNLQGPLADIREIDPSLPEVRVLVRTGDTPASARAAMVRKPPHILVTTPESFYILLTSNSGRTMLRTVRTVIVDEIHALARDKRGCHLALSLERLEALVSTAPSRESDPPYPPLTKGGLGGVGTSNDGCGERNGLSLQRIGLSATQKPIEEMARFLVGVDRPCSIVDVGHRRPLDLAVEIPASPLSAVCSHETWDEIYCRMAELIQEHRTTLIFVNTRKMAERIAARLTGVLGERHVTCHHSSMSRERRLDAEQRLKDGELQALVATASLELGIDIGEVDLVIQIGATRSIATLLQRVGRAGHAKSRIPKGRLFPLTLDELVEAGALLRAVEEGTLDVTPQPQAPLDILGQQIVAACVPEPWIEDDLYGTCHRAWPYRDLKREEFDTVVSLHTQGRHGLLHRDGVGGRLLARRRARLTAITSGGAIPDTADFQVVLEPEGTFIGTLNEDFAIESSSGDIFQLGNTSWRILRIETAAGVVRVADAQGLPPSVPFWLGEGRGRTRELSEEIGRLREEGADSAWLQHQTSLPPGAVDQIRDYFTEAARVLGKMPTHRRVVIERFFDESGGMQLVVHAPFGGRVNRAWGLALRKRFCRGFGFELQAAANEEAIIISLSSHHSFPLNDVFRFLNPDTARDVLIQALLPAPMFGARWRWNATRSLLVERMRGGKKVPAYLIRMRSEDLLASAFPQAIACPENLPGGDLPVPMEHPLVRQTIEDCLTEAMDVDGFLEVLRGLRDGAIETHAVDTPEPSVFAAGILSSQPYTFLDDAPLEERRTRAVQNRRTLDPKTADELGALDPEAVQRVRDEAWPHPENAEEVHEALLWMGYVTVAEADPWREWMNELAAAGRVVREDDRWYAVEAPRDPKEVLRGRLEALGPMVGDDPLFFALESEGAILRTRLNGQQAWCERRLLARIHRYTLDRLRQEIQPVSTEEFLRFLACWQHADEEYLLDGPRGVSEIVRQLTGLELPAVVWEKYILRTRVRDYRRDWLDELTLSGEVVWGRMWGSTASAIRKTPISLITREEAESWLGLTQLPDLSGLSGAAQDIHESLKTKGAMFQQELQRTANVLPAYFERGIAELVSHGVVTCDSFGGLRQLLVPPSKRRMRLRTVGRWSLFRTGGQPAPEPEFVARQLLRRTGVVFRRTILRERQPIPWFKLVRAYRRMELRGEVRGGRFVAGLVGEQYALPEAVEFLRKVRKNAPRQVPVASIDPLHQYRSALTPSEPVSVPVFPTAEHPVPA